MRVAVWYKVPLVIWGEPTAEYTSFYGYDEEEEVDERRFNAFVNLGINAEDMLGMLDNTISDYAVTERDLLPYTYPPADQLRGVRSVLLGSLHAMGRQEAGRDDQARARLEGRPGRRRSARNTTTRRSNASCRACATTSSSSSAVSAARRTRLDRYPQRPQVARRSVRADRSARKDKLAHKPRPVLSNMSA